MSEQLNLLEVRERRNLGMERATAHADRVVYEWRKRAAIVLGMFLKQQLGETFLAENFIDYCRGKLAAPPDARAFGTVIMKARREGLIVKVGYAPAKTSNLSPKCLWRAA